MILQGARWRRKRERQICGIKAALMYEWKPSSPLLHQPPNSQHICIPILFDNLQKPCLGRILSCMSRVITNHHIHNWDTNNMWSTVRCFGTWSRYVTVWRICCPYSWKKTSFVTFKHEILHNNPLLKGSSGVSAIPAPGAVVTAMAVAAVSFFNETDSISGVQAPQLWHHHLHSFSLAPQPPHVCIFVKDICTYLLMIPFV